MTIETTHANGNEVHLLSSQSGTERETRARRFAASIERDHPAVSSVDPGVGGAVDVWLKSEDDFARFHPPDGWAITSVGTCGKTNGVVVVCERTDA